MHNKGIRDIVLEQEDRKAAEYRDHLRKEYTPRGPIPSIEIELCTAAINL